MGYFSCPNHIDVQYTAVLPVNLVEAAVVGGAYGLIKIFFHEDMSRDVPTTTALVFFFTLFPHILKDNHGWDLVRIRSGQELKN